MSKRGKIGTRGKKDDGMRVSIVMLSRGNNKMNEMADMRERKTAHVHRNAGILRRPDD